MSEFNLHEGGMLSSLEDLHSALQGMQDNVFAHHVNSERNDFALWVRGVHSEAGLAHELSSAGSKEAHLFAIARHLELGESAGDEGMHSVVAKLEEATRLLHELAEHKHQ